MLTHQASTKHNQLVQELVMSDDNLTNFLISDNDLEVIYRKLWSVRAILNVWEDYFTERQQWEQTQVCFVLTDLVKDVEKLLPEM